MNAFDVIYEEILKNAEYGKCCMANEVYNALIRNDMLKSSAYDIPMREKGENKNV